MKTLVALFLFAACAIPPAALAQENDNAQVGVFADYFHLSQTNTNFAGLGGRFTLTGFRSVKLEAEAAYDFDQVFTERFTNTGTGIVSVQRSNLRVLHGMIGPKIEVGHSWVHPFVTLKGGAVNFRFDTRPATLGTFVSSVQNLRANGVSGVLYPGGGLEGHLGPLGLRLDVGDEIYFNTATHHNLRVAFGPFIQF